MSHEKLLSIFPLWSTKERTTKKIYESKLLNVLTLTTYTVFFITTILTSTVSEKQTKTHLLNSLFFSNVLKAITLSQELSDPRFSHFPRNFKKNSLLQILGQKNGANLVFPAFKVAKMVTKKVARGYVRVDVIWFAFTFKYVSNYLQVKGS